MLGVDLMQHPEHEDACSHPIPRPKMGKDAYRGGSMLGLAEQSRLWSGSRVLSQGACLFSGLVPCELGSFPRPCANLGPPAQAQNLEPRRPPRKLPPSPTNFSNSHSHPHTLFQSCEASSHKTFGAPRRTRFSQGKCLTPRTGLIPLRIQVKNSLKNPRLSFLCRRFPSSRNTNPRALTPINTYPPFQRSNVPPLHRSTAPPLTPTLISGTRLHQPPCVSSSCRRRRA